jgi:hypothetical protein
MFASGITFTNVGSVSPAPSTLVSANNGLSISVPGNVVLGQNVGAGGNPGQLLSNREIPFNGFDLSLSGTGRLMIGTTVPDATASALQVNNGVSLFNWFMPLTNLALTEGAGFVNGNLFFHTYEPIPIVPGVPTSLFFGPAGAGNVSVTNTNSFLNIGIGYQTLAAITTAQNNVALGVQAMASATIAFNCLGLGTSSLQSLTDGFQMVAVGTQAFQNNVHGQGGTAIGFGAGKSATGNGGVFIGTFMGASEVLDNMVYIGMDPADLGNLPLIYGNMNVGTLAGRWNAKMGVGFRTALPGLPTAQLHIAPGTAAAGTGPLKFSTGVLVAAVENGLMEYDGTHLYFTTLGIRTILI